MANPLLSSQKSSDSLQVVLHPLVVLTITDYATRHTLRQQKGPIVGAVLGQQNGREITMEHAFEAATNMADDGTVELVASWFNDRLEQMKLVHKDRQLDLVGWYCLLPRQGPSPEVLAIHNHILETYNESALLLAFHPDAVLDQEVSGKLPLTIYESNHEVDESQKITAQPDGEDKEMKDSETSENTVKLKFRELPFSVETGEAEMISMDFVAKGGANATTAENKEKKSFVEGDAKGKRRIVAQDLDEDDSALSREDEEIISSLTARANAIKMLHSRIQLITRYLEGLPPSFVSGENPASVPAADDGAPTGQYTTPSHTILRSIQALVSRLPLLVSGNDEAFKEEMLSESNDVHLVALYNDVMQSLQEVRDLGKKFHVVESARTAKIRASGGPMEYTSQSFNLPGTGDLLG